MANEKFTLTWHSYVSHFQGVLGNLFETGESSDNGENMADRPHYDVISEEDDDNESVDENEFTSSTARYESSQHISMLSDSSQCPQCNAVFAHTRSLMRHVRSEHEGVKYPCQRQLE